MSCFQQTRWMNNVDHVVHARCHGRSSQNILVPTGIWYSGRINPVAGKDDIRVKQAYGDSRSYCPPRRQESGGPDSTDPCSADSESSRVTDHKKLQRCDRLQKRGNYAYECGSPNAVPRTAGTTNLQAAKKRLMRGSDAVEKIHNVTMVKNSRGQ